MPTSAKPFVHLHVHTEYSLLDGACSIPKLVQRAKDLGQTSLAITDHGVMYGVVDFYKAAKAAGIKPIIGCEVYVAPRTRQDKVYKLDSANYHLILLCKNKTGYENLIKLVSEGHISGFYNKPRIDHDLLKQHSEGLIALSACLAGEIPQALLNNDYAKAKEVAQFYKDLFGEDFYIELQDHGIEEQRQILPQLMRLAGELGIPTVATNDTHYVNQQDAKTQDILIRIQTNKTVADDNALEFPTDAFYLKSGEEMHGIFAFAQGACENTVKIAEKCDFDFEFGVTKLPAFTAPAGEDNTAFFRRLAEEGIKKHYGPNVPDEVRQRLHYELSVIEKMGYVNYYLIVWDFIHFAKTHDIPVGPGRGSGAGSLVAYCVGITGVDPIAYGLLFERFLNPERISMPDFDIDFCYEKRPLVIDYVTRKYGADHVAQITTFGTMQARAAVRDVGRVLAMPYQQVDKVAKLIPQELKMTLDRALTVSTELKRLYDSEKEVRDLIDIALQIEGMPRHASTHAAGVVITKDPVDHYVPLTAPEGQTVTQFPMNTIEELGLLKIDFLGLRTLTVLSDAEKEIRRSRPDFQLEKIPLDDQNVFAMLTRGEVEGVFQMESGGMRNVLMNLHPVSMEDLTAVISLYRPGPMDSIATFIRNRHHPEEIRYADPRLEPILSVTNGCIVYQEQVMQICRQLAGYTYGQADLVRRAMSKKKHDVMEKERKYFVYGSTEPGHQCVGCVNNGVPARVAEKIFDEVAGFASYAFNKSHAAAYALVAYQTAYLKYYFPKEFMAALLTSVLDSTSKIIEYTTECQRIGIPLLPPDINSSMAGFATEGEGIRFGLLGIKNVGRNLVQTILQERTQNGPFESLHSFAGRLQQTELNRRALESFAKSGAFDSFGEGRKPLLDDMDSVLKSIGDNVRRNVEGQTDLFGAMEAQPAAPAKKKNLQDFTAEERLQAEKEVTGLYLSGHPMDAFKDIISQVSSISLADLAGERAERLDNQIASVLCTVVRSRYMTTKSNQMMAALTVEDLTGSAEVLVFPKILEAASEAIFDNAVVVVRGRVSLKEEEDAKILAEEITPVDRYLQKEKPEKKNGPKLFLRLPTKEYVNMQKVQDLVSIFEGGVPLCYFYEDSKKYESAPRSQWVQPNEMLLKELKQLLGDANVVLK